MEIMKKMLLGLVVMMLFCINAFSQTTEVAGKVTDANGAVVANATILEKGTKNGVTSGTDGTFKIKVKPGARLIISEVGFVDQDVKASGNITVALVNDTKNLNEVIVTAL